MVLADLTGTRMLSGIETGTLPNDNDWCGADFCNYVKFTLDGVHYMAVEDPDDGYRSFCRMLQISDEAPRFSFPPMEMVCTMAEDGEYGEANNILVLTDAVTGEVVLEIGTENYDDWYPCFHMSYTPENMACNVAAQEVSEEEFNKILFA